MRRPIIMLKRETCYTGDPRATGKNEFFPPLCSLRRILHTTYGSQVWPCNNFVIYGTFIMCSLIASQSAFSKHFLILSNSSSAWGRELSDVYQYYKVIDVQSGLWAFVTQSSDVVVRNRSRS